MALIFRVITDTSNNHEKHQTREIENAKHFLETSKMSFFFAVFECFAVK